MVKTNKNYAGIFGWPFSWLFRHIIRQKLGHRLRSGTGRKERRLISPLMVRIMLVNSIALFTFVGGILYLNQFRESLLESRTRTLVLQAETIAGALAESAVMVGESDQIDVSTARQILSRLVAPTQYRVRLFGVGGGLQIDSFSFAGDNTVMAEILAEPGTRPDWFSRLQNLMFDFLDFFLRRPSAPPVIERVGLRADDLPEVLGGLTGTTVPLVRRAGDNQDVINVAVPIQRFRRVLGALLLTAQTEDIETVVRAEQIGLFRVFFGALGLTILLSFFLSRTLVVPIRRLALAAEKVRRNPGKDQNIPKFATRNDEIGDLSRSLDLMTRALYNQIDAVERFAADVVHELKNPLTSMRSALETLERAPREDLRARLMAILADDVRRLDRLITDISEASRLDAELTRGAKVPINLTKLAWDIVNSYQAIAEKAAVTLLFDMNITGRTKSDYVQPSDWSENPEVLENQEALKKSTAFRDDDQNPYEVGLLKPIDFSDGRVMVMGSEARLGQVLRNVLDNALSFSPSGSIITVNLLSDDRMVHIVIKDQGPGLPEGSEEKIFKRFYSERPDHSFGNHSGLGLSIVQQIIEAHDGRIKMSNYREDGKVAGAEFIVSLPLMTKDQDRDENVRD